jgi:hypothetical protein
MWLVIAVDLINKRNMFFQCGATEQYPLDPVISLGIYFKEQLGCTGALVKFICSFIKLNTFFLPSPL